MLELCILYTRTIRMPRLLFIEKAARWDMGSVRVIPALEWQEETGFKASLGYGRESLS